MDRKGIKWNGRRGKERSRGDRMGSDGNEVEWQEWFF